MNKQTNKVCNTPTRFVYRRRRRCAIVMSVHFDALGQEQTRSVVVVVVVPDPGRGPKLAIELHFEASKVVFK